MVKKENKGWPRWSAWQALDLVGKAGKKKKRGRVAERKIQPGESAPGDAQDSAREKKKTISSRRKRFRDEEQPQASLAKGRERRKHEGDKVVNRLAWRPPEGVDPEWGAEIGKKGAQKGDLRGVRGTRRILLAAPEQRWRPEEGRPILESFDAYADRIKWD